MLKYSALIVSIFFSFTLASTSLQTETKLQQREVDLDKFQNTEVLRFAKEELSKQLPQKIDRYTTLVDVSTKASTLIKTYEINSGSKSDEAIIKEDHTRMKNAITRGTCQTSQRFLKSGISLSYIYLSAKSKVKLFQFDISKKDCPNLQ
jgi:hypothetical protein